MPAIIAAGIRALRDAPWLGASRARAWLGVLALVEGLAALAMVLATHGGARPDPWGRPLATDFVSFWTAARLALTGTPAAAWVPALHAAAQRASFAPDLGYAPDYYAFFYPPPFLLICLPLALPPYGVAVAAWLGVTGTAYAAALRSLLPRSCPAVLIALAFPAVLINAGQGQNGMLSTALVAAATVWLDRHPRLAGACLGVLCFKPQLALIVVPALVLARRWGALAWAACSAAALCLASLWVLGPQSWTGFLANAPLARTTLEAGSVGFAKMVSVFAAARLVGAGVLVAWCAQATITAIVLLAVARVAAKRPGAAIEGAGIACASCLVTPFLLDYDLTLLAVPLAAVFAAADRDGFLPWEKPILLAAFALPLIARPLALQLGVPVAPFLVAALFATVIRRAGHLTRTRARHGSTA
jgi:hypothetical protein